MVPASPTDSACLTHPKDAPKGLVLRRLLGHLTLALLLAVALDLFHSKIVGVNLFKYRCEISNSGSFLMRQRELLFKREEKKR